MYADPENWMDREREEARDAAAEDFRDDRPTRAEAERDERDGPKAGRWTGTCGGCLGAMSSDDNDFCLWKGGTWHPACRTADQAKGNTDG